MNEKMLYLTIVGSLLLLMVVVINLGGKSSSTQKSIITDSISEYSVYDSDTLYESKSSLMESPEYYWVYDQKVDEMSGKKKKFANIHSSNYIQQDFPYEGQTYLRITIREQGSTDVYFVIDRGQIQCSEYSGTNCIYARFDEEQPVKFRTVEASSGNSELVFLSGNTKKFINKCKGAKVIKIQIPLYKYGNAVFTFEPKEKLEW